VRREVIGNATLYLGSCLEFIQLLVSDAVVTDPPYPDQHADRYRYTDGTLEQLKINKGFVFWTAKRDFPLPYSAIHIWDKKTGAGSEYERIYEIGGQKNYKVFRHYLINSTMAARYAKDTYTGHPSQKPIALMRELVQRTKGAVLDPFMGSGSTGVACAELGRKFIGVEIESVFFEIACQRIENAQRQERLFA
jgi:site-specific DNA-methyltransferase (adenine-specific)